MDHLTRGLFTLSRRDYSQAEGDIGIKRIDSISSGASSQMVTRVNANDAPVSRKHGPNMATPKTLGKPTLDKVVVSGEIHGHQSRVKWV